MSIRISGITEKRLTRCRSSAAGRRNTGNGSSESSDRGHCPEPRLLAGGELFPEAGVALEVWGTEELGCEKEGVACGLAGEVSRGGMSVDACPSCLAGVVSTRRRVLLGRVVCEVTTGDDVPCTGPQYRDEGSGVVDAPLRRWLLPSFCAEASGTSSPRYRPSGAEQ
jgi:hypothetical protein